MYVDRQTYRHVAHFALVRAYTLLVPQTTTNQKLHDQAFSFALALFAIFAILRGGDGRVGLLLGGR